MAVNQREVSLKVSAVNEASKPLQAAQNDLERLEDAVKAYGAALDNHKGSPRDFARAMSNAFKPLPGIAKDAVSKIESSLEDLNQAIRETDSAMEFGAKQLDGHKKAKDAIDAETAAIRSKIDQQKAAADAAKASAKQQAADAAARIKAAKDEARALEQRIRAEQRAHDAIDKRLIRNRKALEQGDALTPKRRQDLDQKSIEDARLLEESRARSAALAREREEAKAKIALVEGERRAQAALTETVKREISERVAAYRAEQAEISKRAAAEQRAIRSAQAAQDQLTARRSALGEDAARLGGVRDRAVLLSRATADPMAARRASRDISGSPQREARGMATLAAETRRAADAQRLLNGEVRSGAARFSSAKSYVMGLVSAYAIYATAVSQASKAIDAYKAKEAFQITVSNTMGGDMDRASQEFRYMTRAADEYGFAIATISQEYAKLAATARGIGRSDKDIRTMFEGVLSVGRVNNLSDEKMQDAFRAVTQILSKNQVMAEELKGQLAEALPGAVVRFAQSQGFGPDQMKEFSAAMQEGKFAARDIVEYASKELKDNALAVVRAQNTYQATMARFQNTLFKARTDFAEGGFMAGLTETIRELDEFFKSEDGKAYMIRLGEGAQMAVSALAGIARNLDKIMAVLGLIAAAKGGSMLSRMFRSVAGSATAAAAGVTAAGGAATGAARAVGVLGIGLRGLMGIMGGIPGIALAVAGALWSWTSARDARQAAQAQSRLEQVQGVIGKIGDAAINAGKDLAAFRKELAEIDGIKDAISGSTQVANDLRGRASRQYQEIRTRLFFESKGLSRQDKESASAQLEEIVLDASQGAPLEESKRALEAWAKKNGAAVKGLDKDVAALLGTIERMDQSFKDRDDILTATNGTMEEQQALLERTQTANRNAAEAASLAAEAEKKLNDALSQAQETAGDASGFETYERAMKKVGDTKKSLMKDLEAWVQAEKDAGKAVPAEEVERRTRQITEATGRMADKAVADFARMRAEASGMTTALSDVVAEALAAKNQMEQFGGAKIDPLGGFPTLAGGGRKYGADKASIAQGIRDTAAAIGIDPQVLATVISYETAGTFDPKKPGPRTQWGQHRGLIQWGEPQARRFGVDWNDPVSSQLGAGKAIHKYLLEAGVRPGMGLLDVYSAVNAGYVGRYNRSDANNGGAPGTVRDKVERQMGGHQENARNILGLSGSSTAAVSNLSNDIAVNVAGALANGISAPAMDQLLLFLNDAPEKLTEGMKQALAKGDVDAVASMMGEDPRAAAFRELGAIGQETRRAVAVTEALTGLEKAIESLDFSDDDLKTDASRAAALDRETAALIKDLTADGAPLASVVGGATEDQARANARALADQRMRAEWGVVLKEQEQERLEKLKEQHETDEQSIRNAQQRVELERIGNEEARARQEIMYRLQNEEQDGGFKRTDAERNALLEAEMRAWNAENAERLAEKRKSDAEKSQAEREKVHTDRIATLQARLAQLNDQLAAAIEDKDFAAQDSLRQQIAGVSDELIAAAAAAELFYGKMSGPESEQGVIAMQRLGNETVRAKAKLAEASPEAQQLAGTIEGHLNNAVSDFAQRVAEGQDPWKALGQTVKQMVGSILIDIGKMIVKAAFAKAIMGALGLSPDGAAGGDPLTSALAGAGAPVGGGGGFLANAFGFIGRLIGGRFHEGGVIGDPSKNIDFLAGLMNLKAGERPIIAMDGEEMLTRQDPRHRENLGAAFARMRRFHTGGVIGLPADALSASASAAGAATRAMTGAMAGAGAGAAPAPIQVNNYIDPDEMLGRALSTPSGVRQIMNVISQNRNLMRGALG